MKSRPSSKAAFDAGQRGRKDSAIQRQLAALIVNCFSQVELSAAQTKAKFAGKMDHNSKPGFGLFVLEVSPDFVVRSCLPAANGLVLAA